MGGGLQKSREGLVLWSTLNFPVATLSFTLWTLTPVLRFEEELQYLELELGTQDVMGAVLPSEAQQSAHQESSDVGTLQWSHLTMQTVP